MAMHTKDKLVMALIVVVVIIGLFLFSLTIFQSVALGECTTDCDYYICTREGFYDSSYCGADFYTPILAMNIVSYFVLPIIVIFLILKGLKIKWKVSIGYILMSILLATFFSITIWFVVTHIMYWSNTGLSAFSSSGRNLFICGNEDAPYPDCISFPGSYSSNLKLMYFTDVISIFLILVLYVSIITYGIFTAIRACKYSRKSVNGVVSRICNINSLSNKKYKGNTSTQEESSSSSAMTP